MNKEVAIDTVTAGNENQHPHLSPLAQPPVLRAMGFMDIRSFHERAQAVYASHAAPRNGLGNQPELVPDDHWSLPRINPSLLMRLICERNGWVPVQTRTYANVPSGVRHSKFWQRMWRNRLNDSATDGCLAWEPPMTSPVHKSMTTRAPEVLTQIGMDIVASVARRHCDVVILFSADPVYDVIVDKVRSFGKGQFIKLASVYPYQKGSRFSGINRTDWIPVTEEELIGCFDDCIRIPPPDEGEQVQKSPTGETYRSADVAGTMATEQ